MKKKEKIWEEWKVAWKKFEFKRTILEYHLVKLKVGAGWDWECLPISYIAVQSDINQLKILIIQKNTLGMAKQCLKRCFNLQVANALDSAF